MGKEDKFYFQNFAETAALSKQAAEYLVKCLTNYNYKDIEKMLSEMHEIEHSADKNKHEMNEALAKAFVTPVDREDLDMLSDDIDQVIDSIEEVLQKFYIYNIKTVDPSAIEFANKLVKSCDIVCELMSEFKNFKRSKRIRTLIIELNDVEEECDKLYLTTMRRLTNNPTDVLTALSWCKIFDCFEECADDCEHIGDCIRTVIMKNT